MLPMHFVIALIDSQRARLRRDERGATAVEWVVITAFLVLLAVGVAAILMPLITNKASSISLD